MPNFTKTAIKTSFMKLLNEYPLSKISVRSIVEDCGINRNSFYYHYQDIPTLIEEIIKEEVDGLIATYSSISSLDQCAELAFQFALQNRKAVQHIYNSVNRDVYERYSLALARLARECSCRLLDLRSAFLEKWDVRPYFCRDGIHPNDEGQLLLGRAVLRALA